MVHQSNKFQQQISSKQIRSFESENFTRMVFKNFSLICTPVVLIAGHSNWHKNVDLSGGYHHALFERNWLINVQTHVNVRYLLFRLNQ